MMYGWLGTRRPTREVCLCLFNLGVVYRPAQIIDVFTASVEKCTKNVEKHLQSELFYCLTSYYHFGIATLFDLNRTESWYSWNTRMSRIFWLKLLFKFLQRLERKPPAPNRKQTKTDKLHLKQLYLFLQKDDVLFCFIPKPSCFGYNKPTKK